MGYGVMDVHVSCGKVNNSWLFRRSGQRQCGKMNCGGSVSFSLYFTFVLFPGPNLTVSDLGLAASTSLLLDGKESACSRDRFNLS